MGDDVDRQEPDRTCVTAIFAAWRKLPPTHKPKRPATLMRMLGDIYQFPHPDYLNTEGENQKLKANVHSAFEGLIAAAAHLRAVLPSSDNWYVLETFVGTSLHDNLDKSPLPDFNALEEQVHLLANLRLKPNTSIRGARIKAPRLRILAQVICWYLVCIEKVKPKSGFVEETGAPTSKAARIIEATCVGMGQKVRVEEIKTQLNAVKNLKFNDIDFWDLISVSGSDARL